MTPEELRTEIIRLDQVIRDSLAEYEKGDGYKRANIAAKDPFFNDSWGDLAGGVIRALVIRAKPIEDIRIADLNDVIPSVGFLLTDLKHARERVRS